MTCTSGAPARYIAVVGTGEADETHESSAYLVGRGLAEAGVVVVCGGLGGVMAAACRGAAAGGGRSLALLPGTRRSAANPWADLVVPTGLGEARNALIVRAADAVIAIGGGWGTLSEIALAARAGLTVIGLDTWRLPPGPTDALVRASDPADAVRRALVAADASAG